MPVFSQDLTNLMNQVSGGLNRDSTTGPISTSSQDLTNIINQGMDYANPNNVGLNLNVINAPTPTTSPDLFHTGSPALNPADIFFATPAASQYFTTPAAAHYFMTPEAAQYFTTPAAAHYFMTPEAAQYFTTPAAAQYLTDQSNDLINRGINSIKSIGIRAKSSYMSTIPSNGTKNYYMPYDRTQTNPYTSNSFLYDLSANIPADCDTNKDYAHRDPSDPLYRSTNANCAATCYTNPSNTTCSKCYNRELCKNRQFNHTIQTQNDSHDTAITTYLDAKTNYNNEIIRIINLSVGIFLALTAGYIYRI